MDEVAYTTGLTFFMDYDQGLGSNIFSMGPDLAQLEKKNPNPTLNRNEEKNIFIF